MNDKTSTPMREREADLSEIRLRARIDQLEAENAALRRASEAFAELADRLNERLRGHKNAPERPGNSSDPGVLEFRTANHHRSND